MPTSRKTPGQISTFKPAWWLRSAHLQTLYPALFREVSSPPRQRERLRTPDNDFLDLDWCGEQGNATQPLILLLHGLTGSADSVYIKALQHCLLSHNMRSVALNFRGCSGEANHVARCYHSGDTQDIAFVYQTLREREPDSVLGAVGCSLGGNVLVKWLGEQGERVTLFGAVAVSVPFLLDACASKLDRGFSKLYRANLLRELKVYIAEKIAKLERIGNHKDANQLKALGNLSQITSFWEYDERVVAKLHGFESAQDYYLRSSSRQFLKTIATPTLLIHALDDPFMTQHVVPTQDELSVFVETEFYQHGGHVGFVSGNNPFKPVYWLETRITQFLLQRLTNQNTTH
ncbi:MAG TPA: hydrolase [Methylococcaceae bacterium]|nr:hydrolase [Methylococcaceae bacterium]